MKSLRLVFLLFLASSSSILSSSLSSSSSSSLKSRVFEPESSSRTDSSTRKIVERLSHLRTRRYDVNKIRDDDDRPSMSARRRHPWDDLISDPKDRTTLELLSSHHTVNAILQFIELIAQNKSSSQSWVTSGSNGWCILTSMSDLNYPISGHVYDVFKSQASLAVRTSNLLTSILMSSSANAASEYGPSVGRRSFLQLLRSRGSGSPVLRPSTMNDTLTLDKSFFWALGQLNVQSDPTISGSGVVFNDRLTFPIKIRPGSGSTIEETRPGSGDYFGPYVSRMTSDSGIQSTTGSSSNPSTSGHLSTSGHHLLSFTDLSMSGTNNNHHHKIDWFRRHSLNTNLSDVDLSDHRPSTTSEPEVDEWVSLKDGYWTSPYLDCSPSRSWKVTFSVPFFGPSNPSGHRMSFKGVVVVSVNLSGLDIDQCSTNPNSLFANTHKCPSESTDCHPVSGRGLRRGSYVCQCKDGYFVAGNTATSSTDPPRPSPALSKFLQEFPAIRDIQGKNVSSPGSGLRGSPVNHFNGSEVEEAFIEFLVGSSPSRKRYPKDFTCVPCAPGCVTCQDDRPCLASHDVVLRSVAVGWAILCTLSAVVVMIVVFRLRREKSIAMSRWIMLEMTLIGAILLYLTIVVRYFEATPTLCLSEPWLREVGFGFFYGSILIKLYRILAEFQTRKAHRVCVRDKDLLKYLAAIIFVIVGYLAAWTALLLDNSDNLMSSSVSPTSGLTFVTCKELTWAYVTEVGEVCFLLTGVWMTYKIRNARTEVYREKWTLCWIVYLEVIVSSVTYTVRHVTYATLHPDAVFVLYFVRCQLTVTLSLFLLLFSKIWYHNRPSATSGPGGGAGKKRSRFFSSSEVDTSRVPDAMKLHSAVLSNGELDVADISLADMDPEEIRQELRRIYTQLQILKNKTMRKDNPHISKRRGGRKGTHRRFSLQPFTHKPSSSHHHHQHNVDGGSSTAGNDRPTDRVRFSRPKSSIQEFEATEVSRTPEESTTSIDDGTRIRPDMSSTVI